MGASLLKAFALFASCTSAALRAIIYGLDLIADRHSKDARGGGRVSIATPQRW